MKSAMRIAAPLAAFFVAGPIAAYAQNAIMTDDASLRAGPGFNFPRVAYVPEDARVYIHGCLSGYAWCDVSWRGDRGWVDASNLSYSWNNRYVVVEDWGPRIGLPIIAFSVRDYWTRHYRDRPWWNQRQTWFQRDGRDGDWRRDRWDRDDRQRGDRDERRDQRWGERNEWRGRQGGERDEWRGRQGRDRDDDDRRVQQRNGGQRGDWQRENRMNPSLGQGGARRMEQQGGAGRMERQGDGQMMGRGQRQMDGERM